MRFNVIITHLTSVHFGVPIRDAEKPQWNLGYIHLSDVDLVHLLSGVRVFLFFRVSRVKHETEYKGIPRTNTDAVFGSSVSVIGLLTLSAVAHLKQTGRWDSGYFTGVSQQRLSPSVVLTVCRQNIDHGFTAH